MRASSLLLFHSQRPFSICGMPYSVIVGLLSTLVCVTVVLLLLLPVLVLVAFPVLVLGMVPIFFACRKDPHADRVFLSSLWWKRQKRRGFAAGGPYYA